MKKLFNIFVSTGSFGQYDPSPMTKLEKNGMACEFNKYGRTLSSEECLSFYENIDGLIAGTENLNAKMLKSMKKMKVISRCGAGLDNIDLEMAKRLGIKTFNTPDAPTIAVAELTIGLIINLLRKIAYTNIVMKKGAWEKPMGNLLRGKKVGIIGFGRIGQKVGELLLPFGVEIAYYDLELKDCPPNCCYKKFDDLLGWADILTLHLASSSFAKPIIGNNEFKQLKKGSWLLNVSRGGLVDENALFKAVKEGNLSGAALDVFEKEPYKGPLKSLDNVILTSHIGSYARESRIAMENQAVDNLLEGLGVKK